MNSTPPFRALLLCPFEQPIDDLALCAQNRSIRDELAGLRGTIFGAFDRRAQESLGAASVAAVLRDEGVEVCILDCAARQFGVNTAAYFIQQYAPGWIGIAVSSGLQSESAMAILARIRARGVTVHVSLGGLFASANYASFLERFPEVDSVVVGEGEISALELVRALELGHDWRNVEGLAFRRGGSVRMNPRSCHTDFESLPFPARDVLQTFAGATNNIAVAGVFSARRCLAGCACCESRGRPFRYRSPERMVAELVSLAKRFNVRRFHYVDAEFLGSDAVHQARVREFAHLLAAHRLNLELSIEGGCANLRREELVLLKEAGLRRISLGLESGSPLALRRRGSQVDINTVEASIRTCAELAIEAEPWMVLIDSGCTLEELKENIRFLRRNGIGNWSKPAYVLNRLEFSPVVEISSALSYQPLENGWLPTMPAFDDPRMSVVWNVLRQSAVRVHEICEGYLPVLSARAWRLARTSRADCSNRGLLHRVRAWRRHAGDLLLNLIEECAAVLEHSRADGERFQAELRESLRKAERDFDLRCLGMEFEEAAKIQAQTTSDDTLVKRQP